MKIIILKHNLALSSREKFGKKYNWFYFLFQFHRLEKGTQVTCEWCKFAKSDISMISKLQKINTKDEDDFDQYDRDYFCSTNCRYMNDLGVFFKYFLILAF